MNDAGSGNDDREREAFREAPTGERPAPDTALSVQRLGDFEILREIGRGAMGVVYEARQLSLNRRVALKVLPPALGISHELTLRFELEAKAAAKLHHTNIVPVHAFGEQDGWYFYAMDLIEGQPLSRVLDDLRHDRPNPLLQQAAADPASSLAEDSGRGTANTGGRGRFDTVSRLLAEVADGLDYAHSRGVIHRDIKPANLLLSNQGHVCVGDFGLARVAQEPGMTLSGSLMGTPAYMSPEQIAAGRMKLDHRTDIYSLGVVLYEMLTLARPFPGETREEVVTGILTREPVAPRRINSRIPVDLETICLKALEKDPGRRYQTAGQLAADLRQFLQRGLISARRASPLRRAWKLVRRHPVAGTATALSLVFALAVWGVASWLSAQRASEAALRAVSEARYLMTRGDYRGGLQKTGEALALAPGLAEARLMRARLLIGQRRFQQAATEAQGVLRDEPEDWAAHLVLAMAARKGGITSISAADHLAAVETHAPDPAEALYLRALMTDSAGEAVGLLDQAVERDPSHAHALLERSYRHSQLKNFPAARADAERLMAIRPRSTEGRRMIAWSHWNQHDHERALSEFDRAIRLDPADPVTYVLRSRVWADRRNWKEAAADLTRAIELDPANAVFHGERARLHLESGETPQAVADAIRALEIDGDLSDVYPALLEAQLRLGDHAAAHDVMARIERAAERWPEPRDQAQAHLSLSSGYRRLGDPARARAEADRAIELAPQSWRAYLQRAEARLVLGDESGAEEDCEAAATVALDEPEQLEARSVEMRSSCGRLDLAIADATQAIGLAPWWAQPYYRRGAFHFLSGAPERGLSDFNRAIELAENWPVAYRSRHLAYRRMGRFADALRDADRLVELTPESDTGYLLRATTLIRTGELVRAIADLDRCIELSPSPAGLYLIRAEAKLHRPAGCEPALADYRQALGLDSQGEQILAMESWLHSSGLFYACPESFDAEVALRSARRAIEASPNTESFVRNLGAALYRSGSYREAVEHLTRSTTYFAGDALDGFFLAMAHWGAGQRRQARSHYERATRWTEQHAPRDPRLERLQAEAAGLLGVRR